MNDLLFSVIIIALIYYFFYHLPLEKKLNANQPLSISKAVQTETLPNPDDQALESTIDELIKQIKQLNHQLK